MPRQDQLASVRLALDSARGDDAKSGLALLIGEVFVISFLLFMYFFPYCLD